MTSGTVGFTGLRFVLYTAPWTGRSVTGRPLSSPLPEGDGRSPSDDRRSACLGSMLGDAGWSSPVARQAHNLKVVGSNPTPATNKNTLYINVCGGALAPFSSPMRRRLIKRIEEHVLARRRTRHPRVVVDGLTRLVYEFEPYRPASLSLPDGRPVHRLAAGRHVVDDARRGGRIRASGPKLRFEATELDVH